MSVRAQLRTMSAVPFFALGGLAATSAGCDADSAGSGVELRFAAKVGDAPFDCNTTYSGLGQSEDATAHFTDLRFYVSDVVLIDGDGQEVPAPLVADGLWQLPEVALVDFEDGSGFCVNGTAPMNAVVRTSAPEGDWRGVRFTLGVPFAVNHGDTATAPSPLDLTGLFWNWNAGYKFIRVDAQIGGTRGFNLHLGSIGCAMDMTTGTVRACERPNRPSITLSDFDPATDVITLDVAAFYAGVDLSAEQGGAPGCMSAPDDPECRPIFEALGLSVDDASVRDTQQVFAVTKP
jgi:uncharacterized repeat protein (TIGR04052 family)